MKTVVWYTQFETEMKENMQLITDKEKMHIYRLLNEFKKLIMVYVMRQFS